MLLVSNSSVCPDTLPFAKCEKISQTTAIRIGLRKQECLRDYNTGIKATSLQILCVLASEHEAAREEMRQEEVLLSVLRTVQAFPADGTFLLLKAEL